MPDLGPVGPNLWRFCLVPEGARRLWIRRHGRRKFEDLGTQFAGYVHTLSLGDAVYDQPLKKNRRLMFRLTLNAGFRGATPVPTIVYGTVYGPRPRRKVALATLKTEAFARAGIDWPGTQEDGA